MARSIWERAHFADPLGDGPSFQVSDLAPDATIALSSRIIDPGSRGLNVRRIVEIKNLVTPPRE